MSKGASLGEDDRARDRCLAASRRRASSPTSARSRRTCSCSPRAGARRLHDPARAQGLRAVVDVPARARSTSRARRRARSPRRGSRARSSAARSTRTRRRTPTARWRELVTLADHIVLNSPAQWRRHRARDRARRHLGRAARQPRAPGGRGRALRSGRRRARGSARRARTSRAEDLDGLDGLHFHTLCQTNSDALERAVAAFEAEVRRLHPADEVGQLRRRPPHHAARLRSSSAWSACCATFRAKWNVAGLPRARRGGRARHRRAGRAR